MDPKKLIDDLNDILLSEFYRFKEILGRGSFGVVIAAYSSQLDKIVAIKVTAHFQQDIESYLLQECSHPNIVQFYRVLYANHKIYLIMEKLNGQTLDVVMRQRNLNEIQVRYIMHQLLNALVFLHHKGIIHRDLKPYLGLSYQIFCRGIIGQQIGTPLYIAPEMINGGEQTQAVDIFSLGIIYFQMMCNNKHPIWYEGLSKKDYYQIISQDFTLTYPENLSEMSQDFIKNTLCPNHFDRMSAEQCLEHPWMLGEQIKSHPINIHLLRNSQQQIFKFFNITLQIIQALKLIKFLSDFSQKEGIQLKTQDSDGINEMLGNDHIQMPAQARTETNINLNHQKIQNSQRRQTLRKTTSHQDLSIIKNRQLNKQTLSNKYITQLFIHLSMPKGSNLNKRDIHLPNISAHQIKQSNFNVNNIIKQEEFKQSKIQGVTKTICKLKQSNHQNVQISKKIILPILSISRPISTVIKSSVELKLALQCPQERCLGSLCENPCTYNYKVCRVDQKHDLFIFSLQQYDRHQYTKQQICQIIQNMNDQYSSQALECVEQRFKILDNFQLQTLISDNELIEFEQSLHKYPFQCTLQNVNPNNSILSSRIINQKLLDLMGITKDMMFDHLKETQALPTIFNHDGSLKNWCELAQYSVEGREFFDYYLNTYEGSQFRSKVQQKQIFKSSPFDPNQIIFIEFRIIHADPKLLKNLCNSARILKNHAEYFNLKNSDIILNQFKQKTKYLDAKNYQITKPCGYKNIDQIFQS
ncbi:unnamed protein product [Paramecium primaurelia]|uniref:Protein kinase domain-containing protein n=1 Tax=Paramecium primaurelia TaxID=5886 RepID=A0A8S1Q4I8_PARPR|nr:unnamed protein product [Paramecium primaurelia]